MRCLQRNKREIYVAEQFQDSAIMKFKEPVKRFVNYQYTNSDGDLIALGLNFPMYIRIKCDLNELKYFHAKDRVYVRNKPKNPFDPLAKDADYEVDSDPLNSLNSGEITLKRLSGK